MLNAVSRRAKAFTLTETAIVLAVIGLVLSGIWVISSNVREGTTNLEAVNQLQTIKQNILDWRQGQPFATTGVIITSSLYGNGVVPAEYRDVSNVDYARTPWGKRFSVRAQAARVVRLSFFDLPDMKACLTLVLQGTSCQVGQIGCPTNLVVRSGGFTRTPDALPKGWKILLDMNGTSTWGEYLCSRNVYPGAGSNNSVEFDYAF